MICYKQNIHKLQLMQNFAAHILADTNLLLAECEVRTASYGPSFFLPFIACRSLPDCSWSSYISLSLVVSFWCLSCRHSLLVYAVWSRSNPICGVEFATPLFLALSFPTVPRFWFVGPLESKYGSQAFVSESLKLVCCCLGCFKLSQP